MVVEVSVVGLFVVFELPVQSEFVYWGGASIVVI